MFSVTKNYILEIFSDGVKEVKVRWPTDEEWATYFRRRRIVTKRLGGGRTADSEYPDDEKACSELLAKIRLDPDGDLFDGSEAELAITKLARCDLRDIRREAKTFVIEQTVVGDADVTHVIRIPGAKQRRKHDDQNTHSTNSNRERVTKLFIEPSGELYDACIVSSDGYTGNVPLIHKASAISELFTAMDAALNEPRPEA